MISFVFITTEIISFPLSLQCIYLLFCTFECPILISDRFQVEVYIEKIAHHFWSFTFSFSFLLVTVETLIPHWFPELKDIKLKAIHQLDYATSGM